MANQYISNFTTVWNAGATTFNGIKLNVTDTASAAASMLLNLQVGGTTKFFVGKDGAFGAMDGSYFYDPADSTKRARIDAGNVTAGQTRVMTMPDADFGGATLALFRTSLGLGYADAAEKAAFREAISAIPVIAGAAYQVMNVNPAGEISQQNGTALMSADGDYPRDQLVFRKSGIAGTCTAQAGAETAVPGMAWRTRIAMPIEATGAADYIIAREAVEGTRLARLGWNVGGGVMTLATLLRSNTTGVKSVVIRRPDGGASYVHEVSLVANTVKFDYHLVPAPTANAAWVATTAEGFSVDITGRAGTNWDAPSADTWHAADYCIGPNHTNNDGVQENFDVIAYVLLPGIVPIVEADMPYLMRRWSDALHESKRYFQYVDSTFNDQFSSASSRYVSLVFTPEMRVAPTTTAVSSIETASNVSSYTISNASEREARLTVAATASGTVYWHTRFVAIARF